MRIGSIIRDRIREHEAASSQQPGGTAKRKPRKYKVVIHTSPFLRCVQTSIAVSAGIAQDPTPLETSSSSAHTEASDALFSARQRPRIVTGAHELQESTKHAVQLHDSVKTVLRLDAFLGEWQNPEYYALITPPPESVMMLATAKADLLRHEDHHVAPFPSYAGHIHSNSQGQLWGNSPRSPLAWSSGQPDGLENLSPLADALSRSSSMSSQYGRPVVSTTSAETRGYVPVHPHYAISSNAPIPSGYVAHARDACVDVDYQWDSMRGPLAWGDGGSFPEEWPDMRERFRKGLQHLVDWYTATDNPTHMVARATRWKRQTTGSDEECAIDSDETDEDDETEAIVIIVTHGGGCNALIGALTEKPILENFRVTSLTWAERKSDHELSTVEVSSRTNKDRTLTDGTTGHIPIPKYYDVKLVGDTEHLQRSNSTSSQSSIPSRTPSVSFGAPTRGRFTSNPPSSTLNNFAYNDIHGSRASSANPAMHTEHRITGSSSDARNMTSAPRGTWSSPKGGITVGSGVLSFGTRNLSTGLSRTPSIGLWSPIIKDDEEDPMMLLNFGHEAPPTPAEKAPLVGQDTSNVADFALQKSDNKVEDAAYADGPNGNQSPTTSRGLWGSPRPGSEAEPERDLSTSKRRWTVNQMEV